MVITKGFTRYQNDVSGCINGYLSAANLDPDYIVGHSLGGAAATVFYEKNSALHGADLVTFGAPKTSSSGSCGNSGKRIAHESDSISSNVMGVLG